MYILRTKIEKYIYINHSEKKLTFLAIQVSIYEKYE
jgi:hypothetical protein